MKRPAIARYAKFCGLIICALLPGLVRPAANYGFPEELRILERGEKLPLHIPGAKFRIAAFTYEDPDGTKLGDAAAAIVAREILMRTSVSSLGVLNYQGGLAPSKLDRLSYFDKVEKVADAQDVTLSLWGMVRRSGSKITIDSYLQLPPKVVEKYLVWRIALPFRLNGQLIAHLRPDRMLVQRLVMPVNNAEKLLAAAQGLGTLHSEPSAASALLGSVPKGAVYSIKKWSGDWMLLSLDSGASGWVPRTGYCLSDCAPLLDVATFTAALLGFMEVRTAVQFTGRLAPDAQVIGEQIAALESIDSHGPELLEESVLRIERRLNAATASGAVPAGGGALANALAIDKVIALLQSQGHGEGVADQVWGVNNRNYNNLAPDPPKIAAIAFDLAEFSLVDPGNTDVLHNLAVLFGYAGDEKRAALARSLAEKRLAGDR